MTDSSAPTERPSRWATLPGDPPALRRWLADQRGDDGQDDWPAEEPR